jgi:hypothetical protein
VYDVDRDVLWVWHGVYEKVNKADNPATAIYRWNW